MQLSSRIKNYGFTVAAVLLTVAATSAISSQRGGAVTGAPVPIVNTNEAQQTFCQTITASFNGAESVGVSFVVPAGKRLVIEMVSCHAYVPTTDNILNAEVNTTTHGNIASTVLVMEYQRSYAGNYYYGGTQQVKLYADAGTTVYCNAYDTVPSTNGGGAYFTVSGYYVNTP